MRRLIGNQGSTSLDVQFELFPSRQFGVQFKIADPRLFESVSPMGVGQSSA